MKKTTMVMVLLLAAIVGKAQFGMGGRLGFNYIFTGVGLMSVGGFGEKGYEREGRNKTRFFTTRLGADIAFPKTVKYTDYAQAYSSSTDPYQLEIEASTKISLLQFNLDQKMFFGEGTMEDGGIYGGLGIGAWLARTKTTYSGYNTNLYYTTGEPASNYFQFMFKGLIGFEKTFGSISAFGEVDLSIPANTYAGVPVDVQISSTGAVHFGVRYNFGG